MTVPGLRTRAGSSTLRRRLGLSLVVAGLVLGVVILCTGVAVVRMLDRQTLVTETYFDQITRAETAYTRLVDAETSVRGYALTGDPVLLGPYERATAASTSFVDLAHRTLEDPRAAPVRESAAAAAAAAQVWDEQFARPVIAAVAAGGPGAVDAVQIDDGRVLFDETRIAVEAYLADLRDLRAAAVDDLARWTRIVVGAALVLVLSGIAVGIGLWVTLRRWIAAPLAALAADARAVSSGRLEHVVVASGPGEIADLARDVERMRGTLVVQLDALEGSTRELTQAHAQLREQAEELQRSNRDLEQFAYVASHDLQEPLRKIASFTQLLQKRYGGQLDERADQYIDFAVDGAKRMQRLIQDLLGFSRVGHATAVTAEVDLAAALADALDNLSSSVAEAGAEVTHGPLPVVQGERALLVQLLQNLVGNAVKFRAEGRRPQVHVSAVQVGDFWELACRDNGIGIESQYAERVFVIFQRLHPKDAFEGTGIGLALCKKIVEYHGGRIWIDETVADGTRICWTLPASKDDAGRDGGPA